MCYVPYQILLQGDSIQMTGGYFTHHWTNPVGRETVHSWLGFHQAIIFLDNEHHVPQHLCIDGSTIRLEFRLVSWQPLLLYSQTKTIMWFICANLGWVGVGSFSRVVVTFNHVGGPFSLFVATTGDVWKIPSFCIWGHVLHVEHISCAITNCGLHHWSILSLLSKTC